MQRERLLYSAYDWKYGILVELPHREEKEEKKRRRLKTPGIRPLLTMRLIDEAGNGIH
jgi:hypothetical protein